MQLMEFHAHPLDPLGGLNLVEADFAWAQLMKIAERHAKGRIVSVLEGGYHLEGLARSGAPRVPSITPAGGIEERLGAILTVRKAACGRRDPIHPEFH